ncbi:hypothetical protein CHU92_02620 [Flavobacterium cyanobacteriorum]|uniref:Outer membrane chaperone Skp n=1 Tax=Flavobacterium cyanobacteriorum TaxID=2022802 RepID=A0A255ZS73_9FLAO|nr:OmpH family outer membrane protein [Flavobacterium cyanobacteriorum]OYQ44286.1 hypothetical protein CHU92_02620 [Flavobacterium cyanobacteriorum]
MRKSLLLFGFALALLSCNKEQAAGGKEFKTAYVDTYKLLEESEEMKDFTNKAKVKEGELSRELQQKAKELQLDAASFESEARVKGMQWAQLKQQELQKRQRDLGIMQETFREEFDKEFGVKRDTIVSQMRKFIKDYGKKNGYDYIYGTGEAATVLYAREGYDITKKLIKELNEKYKAQASKEEPAKKEEKN